MTTTKRIFTITALTGLALIGASTASAHAATFTVCATGCQFTSIQAAVNAASGSDHTIEVRAGTYSENVTIPAGREGLVLRGAQAGKAGDVAPRPVTGQESMLQGDGTALRVLSSRVTVDGLAFGGFPVGIWSDAGTSGLRVLNNVFSQTGNAVVPDSNGDLYSVVRHNAFINNAVDRGLNPGSSIITGASRGRLLVEDNRITGPGALVFHYGRAARDVTVARNRAESGSWWLAALYNVDDAVVQDNLSSGAGALAYLTDTRDAKIYRNTLSGGATREAVVLSGAAAPNRQTVIEGNDFGAGANGVVAFPGSVAGTLTVHYNRFAPGTLGLRNDGEASADARYNWWGCNEGPADAACARLDGPGTVNVTRAPWLTLSIETDSTRIENANGGSTGWRASVLRDSSGTLHQPLRFPPVVIVTTAPNGTRFTSSTIDSGVVGGTLTAQGEAGVDLTVRTDGATAATRVAFGSQPVDPAGAGADGRERTAGRARPHRSRRPGRARDRDAEPRARRARREPVHRVRAHALLHARHDGARHESDALPRHPARSERHRARQRPQGERQRGPARGRRPLRARSHARLTTRRPVDRGCPLASGNR